MAAKFILAIDLGGTNLKIALLNLKYKILDRDIRQTRQFTRKERLITAIVETAEGLLSRNHLKKADIVGVGLGLPGPVDYKHGLVHFFPNIPGWKQVNLKAILKQRLGRPIFLDNDAKLMCLAEYKLGAAKGARNAICLTLGTGVGGGIIIEGNLYRGSSFAAGEIGHLPINLDGPQCNCGGKACLEAYIGNHKILSEAKKIFNQKISLEELSLLAKNGNQKARGIWLRVAQRLGVALVAVINLLNPDCIVIGGGVAGAGKLLFDKLRKVIVSRAMLPQAKDVKIFKARLGSDAGLIGAAILVKENTCL